MILKQSKSKTKKNKQKNSSPETHQTVVNSKTTLTTQQGTPIGDDQNTLKVTDRGPSLLEDFHFREKIFHFDHERIPERVVHARGFGAHGFFENYAPLSEITCADLFQEKNQRTPVFIRFSTVVGNKGSSDLARDVRGFAVKFYTQQGNWDLVGNNIPVFFIQDAIKFPDLIHAAKPEPDIEVPQAQTAHDNFWDFISLMPESMHMIMWVMSDRAIPRSFRFMEGFGVHTFRMLNAKGKSKFVKFHWKPKLGMQSVLWNEAVKINGADPDFHRRDLWNAIKSGNFPEWELGLQIFDEKFASRFPFDILDSTKIIPEEDVPIKRVGRLVLDRCVDNFFAETEQVAFCTQNIVPGIDFTNDPLLQGRNFSYLDTQLKRLGGPNFSQLPINAPKCPMQLFQQDGAMAFYNPKGRVNYEPNSWGGPRENPEKGFHSFSEEIVGKKLRARPLSFSDYYSQARQFYISQTPIEQNHIAEALIFELSKVKRIDIRERVVSHLLTIDHELGLKVTSGLRLKKLPLPAPLAKPIKKLSPSKTLSILLNPPAHFGGRKIGILMTDGADASLFKHLSVQAKKEKIDIEIISTKIGGVKLNNTVWIDADKTITNGPSVLYDAIAILSSTEGTEQLIKESHFALQSFLLDAFNHLKFIAYVKEASSLFEKSNILSRLDSGCVMINNLNTILSFFDKCKALRYWARNDYVS